jgi:hypothetical protein
VTIEQPLGVGEPKSSVRPFGLCDRISIVAVRPVTRVSSAGIRSSKTRTGTRRASRTQLNVGLTSAKQCCPLGAIAAFHTGSDALHMPPKRDGTAHQADGDPITNVNARQFGFLEMAIHMQGIGIDQSHDSLLP